MKELIFFIIAGMLLSCSSTEKKEEQHLRTVQTAEASEISSVTARNYSFVSKPYMTADLSFRVGGPVTVFDVQPGQFFRKGDIIAEIDSRDYIIACDRAQAVFEQAEAEYRRISSLYGKGNISESAYEKAKSDYMQARSAYETAKFNLSDTKLTAPFDGYIQDVNIERFQDVRPSFPVVSFIDVSMIKVEVYVPEDVASYIRNGGSGECRITFNGFGDKVFTAREIFVSQSTTKNNISYLLTALITNTDNCLIGGMSGNLSFFPVYPTSVSAPVAIPQNAVVHKNSTGSYVWRLNNDSTVVKTGVTVGRIIDGNRIEITGGLEAGDRIVTTGIHYLSENEKVNVQ